MTSPLLLIPNYPTSEMVAVEWIATVPGFTCDMTGEQLPPDAQADGSPPPWVANETGFAQVSAVVGGTPGVYLPVNSPVLQIDCWAVTPGSDLPPWNVASALATAIWKATLDRFGVARHLDITQEGVAYPPASVQAAKLLTQPRRVWGDEGDNARVTFDLWLQWICLTDVLD